MKYLHHIDGNPLNNAISNLEARRTQKLPNLPVAVIHEPTLKVVKRFSTIKAAEAHIAALENAQPEAVHRGDYGIDAPERLLNPTRKRKS